MIENIISSVGIVTLVISFLTGLALVLILLIETRK